MASSVRATQRATGTASSPPEHVRTRSAHAHANQLRHGDASNSLYGGRTSRARDRPGLAPACAQRRLQVTSNGAKFLSRGVCAVFLDENPRVLQPHRVPSCPRGHDLTSLSERLQRDRHAPRRQNAESMLTRHSAARATTHRGRAASLHSRRVRVTLTAQATPWTMFSLWIKWHVPSSMLSSEPMSPAQSLRSSLGSFGAWKVTTPVGRSILA